MSVRNNRAAKRASIRRRRRTSQPASEYMSYRRLVLAQRRSSSRPDVAYRVGLSVQTRRKAARAGHGEPIMVSRYGGAAADPSPVRASIRPSSFRSQRRSQAEARSKSARLFFLAH